jgi:ABC-type sugar transport system substrate-binding protein
MRVQWARGGLRLLLAAALVVGVAGSTFLGVTPARAQEEPLRIAFSTPGLSFPFFVHMDRFAKQEAERIGGIEIISLDAQNDAAKQVADIEAAIAQGVDGIMMSPHSPAAGAGVEAAIAAGIPIVTIDRAVDVEGTLAHVGADNVRGGEIQGEYLIEILPEGGEIFELQGTPGASPAIDRSQGLANALAGQDKITIGFQQTGQFTPDGGLAATEGGLAAHPEGPAAVVCGNDEMCFGAIEALEAAGITGVPVIGFDALPPALEAVADGSMTATVDQWPGKQVGGALTILVEKLRNGTDPAEHDNFIEPTLIDKDNLQEAERISETSLAEGGGTPEASAMAPVLVAMRDLELALG